MSTWDVSFQQQFADWNCALICNIDTENSHVGKKILLPKDHCHYPFFKVPMGVLLKGILLNSRTLIFAPKSHRTPGESAKSVCYHGGHSRRMSLPPDGRLHRIDHGYVYLAWNKLEWSRVQHDLLEI